MPAVGERLPGERPGFTAGDPRDWIPGALATLEQAGKPALPWTSECDFLFAPYPLPGRETEVLLELLAGLHADYPVALYERDVPLLPNLLVPSGTEDRGHDFATPAAGLRAYRSAFRQRGRGGAEAFVLLPARRLAGVLRGSFLGEIHPGPGGSLQNRRFLALALDHQRSLHLLPQGLRAAGPEPAGRVAVVMPHFDDDVIQCGGALLAARAAGAEVRMIWMTDGARGIPAAGPEESARVRREEAEAAMGRLGIADLHFLEAPETRLERRGPWTARLRRLLREFQPDRVHTVWWADNNVDHFETNRVLRAAWPRELDGAEIAASGFWTPILGNRCLPLTPEVRRVKDAALAAYASQIAEVDYLRVERGLSRWYGREEPGECYAEEFLCLPAAEYWQRYRASGASRRWFLPSRRKAG